jgi:hypothetical protein
VDDEDGGEARQQPAREPRPRAPELAGEEECQSGTARAGGQRSAHARPWRGGDRGQLRRSAQGERTRAGDSRSTCGPRPTAWAEITRSVPISSRHRALCKARERARPACKRRSTPTAIFAECLADGPRLPSRRLTPRSSAASYLLTLALHLRLRSASSLDTEAEMMRPTSWPAFAAGCRTPTRRPERYCCVSPSHTGLLRRSCSPGARPAV